jgi:hypothetical protein
MGTLPGIEEKPRFGKAAVYQQAADLATYI